MPNPWIKVYNSDSGLDPSKFLGLVVPCEANVYLLKNAGPDTMYMRSSKDDPLSEDTIQAGGAESFTAHLPHGPRSVLSSRSARYLTGDVLYYVKCTGPVIAKFWI